MKYRKTPLTAGIMALIASVGCIAVGFSSWSMGAGGANANLDGTLESDGFGKLLALNKNESNSYTGYTSFEVCDDGFVLNDAIVSTAVLKYDFVFSERLATVGYMSENKFYFESTLSIISSLDDSSVNNYLNSISVNSSALSGFTISSNSINYSFSLDYDNQDYSYFSVSFEFNNQLLSLSSKPAFEISMTCVEGGV